MSNPPSGYNTPKTNWQSADVVLPTDMNRIEGNINAIETGSRTIDPAQSPSGNSGSLRQWLDWLPNMIKKITGKTNWYDAPDTTLAAAKTHIDATSAHSATSAAAANRIILRDASGRAQVAAPSASADIARKDNVDAVQNNLNAKMDPITGHKHTGVPGDGPLLPIRLIDYKEYRSSGTWTKPAGAQFILVQCIGGGAGGRHGSGGIRRGGGGGGGNCMRLLRADIVPETVNITVGAGGSPYGNGGTSSFGNATGVYVAGYGGTGQAGGGAGTPHTGNPAWGNLGGAADKVAVGISAEYGGAGAANPEYANYYGEGGSSLWGGGAGGGGGGYHTNVGDIAGASGGSSGHGAVPGGAGGTGSSGNGANGSDGFGMFAGGGGGGGARYGRGGNGGFPGGGGGARGADTPDNSYAGRGGAGVVRVWVW